jgi:hypothetical protein
MASKKPCLFHKVIGRTDWPYKHVFLYFCLFCRDFTIDASRQNIILNIDNLPGKKASIATAIGEEAF